MDFGQALAAVRAGARIVRTGWTSMDKFVAYQAGYPGGVTINANTSAALGIPEGTVCKFRPYLVIRTADGDFVPWVASQTDLLAEDWLTV